MSWLVWSLSIARVIYESVKLFLDVKKDLSGDDEKKCVIEIESAKKK